MTRTWNQDGPPKKRFFSADPLPYLARAQHSQEIWISRLCISQQQQKQCSESTPQQLLPFRRDGIVSCEQENIQPALTNRESTTETIRTANESHLSKYSEKRGRKQQSSRICHGKQLNPPQKKIGNNHLLREDVPRADSRLDKALKHWFHLSFQHGDKIA